MKILLSLSLYLGFLSQVTHAIEGSLIIFSRGDVIIEREGKILKSYINMKLHDEDQVKTGVDSLAIVQVENHSKMKIDDNSTLTITLKGHDSEGSDITYINLVRGSFLMDFTNDKYKNKEISVEVKQVSLGVRGTRFLVGAEEGSDEKVTLAVERGEVEIYDFKNNDYESVGSGKAIIVERGKGLTKPYGYKWMDKLSWDPSDHSTTSKFSDKGIQKSRNREFSENRKELGKRDKKEIPNRAKNLNKREENRKKRNDIRRSEAPSPLKQNNELQKKLNKNKKKEARARRSVQRKKMLNRKLDKVETLPLIKK